MPEVVIDASVACAWCFPDEQTAYASALLQAARSLAVDMVVPRLWAYEIRNSILMGVRRNRMTRIDGQRFLLALSELDVHLAEPASYDGLFSLADEQGLTVYDA